MNRVINLSGHRAIQLMLTALRNKDTPSDRFAHLIREISVPLLFEALRYIEIQTGQVETPLEVTDGYRVAENIALIPIMRAGMEMIPPARILFPESPVYHLGMFRDDANGHQPQRYYPQPTVERVLDNHHSLIFDIMLATGGSAKSAISQVAEWGCKKITFLCIIAAPEGIKEIQSTYPSVQIIAATIDRKLNEQAYILPGLGDAGDRVFGTK